MSNKRPLSVWVLTILNGVFAGFLIAVSLIAENHGYTAGQAAINGILGVAITISAHATWYGYRWGRIALLTLITLYLGQTIVWSVMVINWADDINYHGPIANWAVARAIGSVAWLVLNWMFLFNKRARAFFG